MFLILFTILIGILIAYRFYKYQTYWKYIQRFPGPSNLPILGNTHHLGWNLVDNLKNALRLWKIHGCEAFLICIGYFPFIILTEPKDVEYLLASTIILKKSILYDLFSNWLGEGLLTSFGNKWFTHRKMITPSFHFKILTDFHEIMKKKSNKFVEKLAQKSIEEEIFDVQDMVHYCTLDVICETAMGTEINAMDNHHSELVKAFQDMCYVIIQRCFNPFKFITFLYKFSKEYQIEKKALNLLETFTMDIIKKRRQTLEQNVSDQNNLKQSGINGSAEECGKLKHVFLDTLLMATIDGKPLTNQEIFEEVSTFMFEGHDTTTSGITFSIHTLSRHQHVQAKVYEEQVSIFGKENLANADPSYQDVQEMKYLDLVIKESLRLYPSVPIIGRLTTEPTYLGDKYVPANTSFLVFVMAMGYNAKIFPDPYKFDPERFRDRKTDNPFDYVPFSAGPRNCIGQKFAMLEMKSVLSDIIRNFEILPAVDECLNNGGYEHLGKNKYDPLLATVLTLKSDNGVHIRLRPRTK